MIGHSIGASIKANIVRYLEFLARGFRRLIYPNPCNLNVRIIVAAA